MRTCAGPGPDQGSRGEPSHSRGTPVTISGIGGHAPRDIDLHCREIRAPRSRTTRARTFPANIAAGAFGRPPEPFRPLTHGMGQSASPQPQNLVLAPGIRFLRLPAEPGRHPFQTRRKKLGCRGRRRSSVRHCIPSVSSGGHRPNPAVPGSSTYVGRRGPRVPPLSPPAEAHIRSVHSQGRFKPSRPKCPYAAVDA